MYYLFPPHRVQTDPSTHQSLYASYDSLFDTLSTHAMLHDDYSLHSLPNSATLVQNDSHLPSPLDPSNILATCDVASPHPHKYNSYDSPLASYSVALPHHHHHS